MPARVTPLSRDIVVLHYFVFVLGNERRGSVSPDEGEGGCLAQREIRKEMDPVKALSCWTLFSPWFNVTCRISQPSEAFQGIF